eukprot:10471467-Karenia_brevis.AAC.1
MVAKSFSEVQDKASDSSDSQEQDLKLHLPRTQAEHWCQVQVSQNLKVREGCVPVNFVALKLGEEDGDHEEQ